TFDGVEQRLFAGGVTFGALEPALRRPPAVAVHHDGDVAREMGKVDALGHVPNLQPVSANSTVDQYRPIPSPPMRWRAVVNPSAGRGRTRKLLPRLTDAFASTGLDVDVRVSVDLDDAVGLAREAFEDGRGVAACGGDGTVNALAGVAADHDGVLAIVPTGAGNDFARHLGL